MRCPVRFACSWISLALVVAAGCSGSSGYTVKGKITHGGQPFSFADDARVVMSFVDVMNAEKVYPCTVNEDSTYETDVPAGKYNVSVVYYDKSRVDQLGGKYTATTPLQVEVTGSTDELDIDVPAGS